MLLRLTTLLVYTMCNKHTILEQVMVTVIHVDFLAGADVEQHPIHDGNLFANYFCIYVHN